MHLPDHDGLMPTEQRRLATFMFTDMVGYSVLTQKNDALAADLLAEHRQILRTIFATHRGQELDAVGDGFLVEFSSTVDAARCAMAIQERLRERNTTVAPERKVQVRIGLHLGDVVVRDGRAQGDGVNIAARIEPLALPGGICLSEDVARQIQNRIDLPIRKLGGAELKNIRVPVDIYRLVHPGERRLLRLPERLAFSVRRQQTRWFVAGGSALLVAIILAGTYVWQQASKPAASVSQRLAVLPFASLSPDKADEYFADGITEELIAGLSRIKGLEVIARTSVMPYKGTSKKIAEIGRELGVGTVLEGSVRKGADKVRITAQLIRVDGEGHLWAETYDRELKDVFAVQIDVAGRVADALKVRLVGGGEQRVGPRGIVNTEAYTLTLQGRHWANKDTEDGLRKGIRHLELAIRKDPNFALAHAALAHAYIRLPFLANVPVTENYTRAREEALRALELDKALAEAHTALGLVKVYHDWDWAGAEEAFKRALTLSPSYAPARHGYGFYLLSTRQVREAVSEMRRALALDPVSVALNVDLGWFLHAAGRNDDAIRQFQKALELDPKNYFPYAGLGYTYAHMGMMKESEAAFLKEIELMGRNSWTLPDLAYLYGKYGRNRLALDIVGEMEAIGTREPVQAYSFLLAYTGLSERDPAYREAVFEWLHKSYAERTNYAGWINGGPWWNHVRSDPRFVAIMKRMGFDKRGRPL